MTGIFELKRMNGWLATGKSGVNDQFPFDPLGLNGGSMAVKEAGAYTRPLLSST
jgi:light-harvesting complex I chlorophyll a/b binding protein 5